MTVDVQELADALVEPLAQRLAAQLDTRPLLSVKEAGVRLGVSDRTVRDMLSKGVLPSLMVEGSRRIEPAAIDSYLEQQKGRDDG